MDAPEPLDKTGLFENRQFNVLLYWAEGELTKVQIGDKFGLSEGWANKELRKIYKLLGVRTRQGAVMKAWKLKIFTVENT